MLPTVESESCGIFYTSRFFRLHDGADYPVAMSGGLEGVSIIDFPHVKGMVARGDDRTFSITMCADPDDPAMRPLMKSPGFDRAVAAMPVFEPWIDPRRAEPISDVHVMASIRNMRRTFTSENAPLVTGYLAIGDALMHTNPIAGLGCSLGWVGAFLAADALAETDPGAVAMRYHLGVEREIVPWYDGQVALDRATVTRNAAQRSGDYWTEEDPGDREPSLLDLLRYGLRPASQTDIRVLRRLLRRTNLLDQPHEMFVDPEVMAVIEDCYHRRHEFEPRSIGPSRDELIQLIAPDS